MPGNSANMDFIDRLADCVLVAYLDNGGSVDNHTLVRYVHTMIEGEHVLKRFELAPLLMDARRRLRMQALIERVQSPGKNAPAVWRLTILGKDRASFIKETRFPD